MLRIWRRYLAVASVMAGVASVAPAATEAATSDRVALVIGNAAYTMVPPLTNAGNDAKDIAAVLKQLGFDVKVETDLGKAGMEKAIKTFSVRLRRAKIGLFFYAGHGVQLNQQNYLVPVDATLGDESSVPRRLVALETIQRTMERGVRTRLIFLDACRDSPVALTGASSTRSLAGRGLAAMTAGEGTLIAFSTQPGNVAVDGKGRNSPFSGALVRHIGTPGEDLTSVLIEVRNDVMAATKRRQIPWEHSSLTGRVYLNTAAVEARGQVETVRSLEKAAIKVRPADTSDPLAEAEAEARRLRGLVGPLH